MAALQGVDIDENVDSGRADEGIPTVEEIQARAIARLTGDRDTAGAVSQGFTPDMGVNYSIVEGAEIG